MTDDDVQSHYPETASEDFPSTWRLLDDVEVLQLPDPEYLIDGMIPRRGVGAVYGPPGSGKTTFIAGLMVSVAALPEFHGHAVRHRGASVYCATEDAPGIKVRLRARKQAAHLPLDQAIGVYTFPEPLDLRDDDSVDRFGRFLEHVELAQPLELLVVDTYAASMPGGAENSSEDTTLAMSNAARWRDQHQCTVLLVHHTNASGSRERGHSGLRGACDFMISLTPVDDVIHVESSKQRNGPPFPTIALKLLPMRDGGCVLRLAGDVLPSSTLTSAQVKALAVLKETFAAEGATKGEWQRACHDVPERTFHRVAKVLAEQGHVRLVGTHFRPVGKVAA